MAPVKGLLYTDVDFPSTYPGAAELGPGPKSGSASASNVLGLIATGDASVEAACRDGGITKIHTVDIHATNILLLWGKYTVNVTGE